MPPDSAAASIVAACSAFSSAFPSSPPQPLCIFLSESLEGDEGGGEGREGDARLSGGAVPIVGAASATTVRTTVCTTGSAAALSAFAIDWREDERRMGDKWERTDIVSV